MPTELFSLPIIELSYVHRIVYRDGLGNYHYEVSYLCQFNGDDALVVKTYPCTEDQLYSLPMITKETTIVSYNEDGTPTK